MASRHDVLERFVDLVGRDVLTVTDPLDTWPAEAELVVEGIPVPVALHVGPIGLSHRGRDDVERRFQNPASERPVANYGYLRPSLLLGLWTDDPLLGAVPPVVAMADPVRRFGQMTRVSIFTKLAMLVEAGTAGWAEGTNTAGEEMIAFAPSLLPVAFAQQRSGLPLPPAAVQTAVEHSGLLDSGAAVAPQAAARAVRAGLALVRDRKFSGAVRALYRGRCAMCGLGSRLTQGAHILPVSAPGSTDHPSNGLSLCANHHLAFDNHDVAVVPATGEIVFRPLFLRTAKGDAAAEAFIASTATVLAEPDDLAFRPTPDTFEQRYRYHEAMDNGADYGWVPR